MSWGLEFVELFYFYIDALSNAVYWFINRIMALGLQFMHLVRLSIMPIVYYKIRQVQTSAPKEHEEGQGEGHAAHWS